MVRGAFLKQIVPLQEIRRAPPWKRCRETRMGLGSDNLNLSTRVAFSTTPPCGNDDFENRRKLLIEKSNTGRQEEILNQKASGRPLRKLYFAIIASSCVIFMITLGYMAYSPSFRAFQRTESPRISQIADIILGVEKEDRSDSDTGPSIEDEIQKQRFRDLRRQRETARARAQCSADVR